MSFAERKIEAAAPAAKLEMVALDVDDTLLEADLSLLPACAEAIRAVQAAGVRVVLATGRMYRSVLPYAERLGLSGYLVTYNGALIRSVEGETLWHKPVPPAFAEELIAVAAEEDFTLNLYIDDEIVVERIDERVEYYVSIAGVPARPVGDLRRALEWGEPTKCLFVGDAERVPRLVEKLRPRFPELQITRSKPRFIEVTRGGVQKELGLAAVAEAYGVAREAVMAVGDAENDISMIAWAGWGVAVANASDGAKAAADAVMERPRGAGVCEALRRYVLGEVTSPGA